MTDTGQSMTSTNKKSEHLPTNSKEKLNRSGQKG